MGKKANELRDLSPTELRDRETALAEQLFALRLQRSTGQLEKAAKIGETRRNLARILTVLREKQGQQG